jgi:hypothetical protein
VIWDRHARWNRRQAAPRRAGTQGRPVPAAAARGRLHGSILETVGATPLVLLPRLGASAGLAARLALKLEFFNPLGSVKDRIGLAMVEAAEREGSDRAGPLHAGGADLGQHRHRARLRRRREGIPADRGDAGRRQHRAAEDDAA